MLHAEQECSGALPELLLHHPQLKIRCTRKCYEHLVALYPELRKAAFDV